MIVFIHQLQCGSITAHAATSPDPYPAELRLHCTRHCSVLGQNHHWHIPSHSCLWHTRTLKPNWHFWSLRWLAPPKFGCNTVHTSRQINTGQKAFGRWRADYSFGWLSCSFVFFFQKICKKTKTFHICTTAVPFLVNVALDLPLC